ncbi:MAG: hypothetical protein RSG23_05175 [Gordonibacter sp.]|uniref:hypothetical protein n=1 Tax=Gordonibacter sp. TaxID=1968902 RepID=UPI002FC85C33
MSFRLTLKGDDKLAGELNRLSSVRFDAVVQKNMTQIYARGKAGGTPVDTGELKGSLVKSGDVVGYAKSYAPHVEYGHRTRGNGYVQGQKYLYNNVETQRPIFRQDLIKQLKKG